MKKRIFATILILAAFAASVICVFVYQKDKPTSPGANQGPQFIQSQRQELLYNNFFFYVYTESSKGEMSYSTLKYHNLGNVQKQGIPLYGDVLSEEDPFRVMGQGNYYMAVDEKATAENDGMPVLIIEYAYESGWTNLEGDQDPNRIYGIFSFNTATNQLTALVENLENPVDFWLCNDTIYFAQYLPVEDSEYEYGSFPFTITTKGENLTKYTFPDNLGLPMLGGYNDKLYFLHHQTGSLYTSDLHFENYELLMTDLITLINTMNTYPDKYSLTLNTTDPFISNGYLYYTANRESAVVDGKEIHYRDIMRKPLDDPDANEELVLDNIYTGAGGYFENCFYYYRLDEVQVLTNTITIEGEGLDLTTEYDAMAILHEMSLVTGEDKIVFDHTKNKKRTSLSYVTKNYYITYDTDTGYHVVNRQTGEEVVCPDL